MMERRNKRVQSRPSMPYSLTDRPRASTSGSSQVPQNTAAGPLAISVDKDDVAEELPRVSSPGSMTVSSTRSDTPDTRYRTPTVIAPISEQDERPGEVTGDPALSSQSSEQSPRGIRIVVLKRNGADGAHFPLTSTSSLFGRSDGCDFRIPLPNVSKEHCRVDVNQDGQVFLTNLSQVTPTILNGKAVLQTSRLEHNDTFTIIDRSFRVEFSAGSPSTEVSHEEIPGLVDTSINSPWSPYLMAPPTVSSQTIREDLQLSDDEDSQLIVPAPSSQTQETSHGSTDGREGPIREWWWKPAPEIKMEKNEAILQQIRRALEDLEQNNQRPQTADIGTQTDQSGAPENIINTLFGIIQMLKPELAPSLATLRQ